MLDRGREAFAKYLLALPEAARPIGGAMMAIICEDDFIREVRLVMSHVHASRSSIYILDANYDLQCLMAPFTWRR